MSYQVLARKWRPRNFSEVVGQEHVLRALTNALDHDRLHHAFLFTGTRGVGKTTIARALAKSLNCEQGVSSNPCGECESCREIDEGRFVDLIEVDAASRRKVEETNELLDNVQYAPTRGRYKVYLVDEVHMLSDHSFNALLKTLEEPPPHVKFLLATTDPQKLPMTVLSRCLQFDLKRLPIQLIADHLARVLEQEQIPYESAALKELGRAADGSVRDALSLLDQAIAHADGRVTDAEVRAMLGTLERGQVVALVRALADGDGNRLMESVADLADQVPDFTGVLTDLLSLLHRIALAQVVPDAVDDSLGDREVVLELAGAISPEDAQLFYQIGLMGRRDLAYAPEPRSGLEMTLLRMLAFRPAQAAPDPGQDVGVAPSRPAPASSAAQRQGQAQPQGQAESESQAAAGPQQMAGSSASAPSRAQGGEWDQIVEATGLKAAARELAFNCALEKREEDRIYLVLNPSCEHLGNSQNARQRLEQALAQYYNAPVKLHIRVGEVPEETPAMKRARTQQERHQEAVQSIEQDSVVQDLQKVFDAEVSPDRIQPVD